MTKKTSPSPAFEPTQAQKDEPRDIVDALKLRSVISRYAAGSEARSALTLKDTDELETAISLLANLRLVVFTRDLSDYANGVSDVIRRVEEFNTLNRATDQRTVAGVTISAPAIGDAGLRAHIARLGAELVAEIDSYIARRRAGIARAAAKDYEDDLTLAAAKKLPVLGAALTLYEETMWHWELHPTWGIAGSAAEGASRAIEASMAFPDVKAQLPEGTYGHTLKTAVQRAVKRRAAAEKVAA